MGSPPLLRWASLRVGVGSSFANRDCTIHYHTASAPLHARLFPHPGESCLRCVRRWCGCGRRFCLCVRRRRRNVWREHASAISPTLQTALLAAQLPGGSGMATNWHRESRCPGALRTAITSVSASPSVTRAKTRWPVAAQPGLLTAQSCRAVQRRGRILWPSVRPAERLLVRAPVRALPAHQPFDRS